MTQGHSQLKRTTATPLADAERLQLRNPNDQICKVAVAGSAFCSDDGEGPDQSGEHSGPHACLCKVV